MKQAQHHCDLNLILKNAAKNHSIVCVFDLDSTLFNVSYRTQKILNEFAEAHQPQLKDVEILHTDWGLKESLARAGFDSEEHPEIHKHIKKYWMDRFFTNEYLHYDVPYLGATAFTQKLALKEFEIHYLTGRDVHRMGAGTEEVLLKWGFPLKPHHLHLKPHRSMNDHEFKVNWVHHHFPVTDLKSKNQKLFFFENEPVNINALGQLRPDIQIVYLDTTHSRQETVSVPVITIQNFNFDSDKDSPC